MENTFLITQPGQYWLNLGVFAEYSQSAFNGEPNSFAIGPNVQKQLYNTLGVDGVHTLNVFFEHDIGHNATQPRASKRLGSRGSRSTRTSILRSSTTVSSMTSEIPESSRNSSTSLGLSRSVPSASPLMARSNMFGMTSATPKGAIRWKLEYEIAF